MYNHQLTFLRKRYNSVNCSSSMQGFGKLLQNSTHSKRLIRLFSDRDADRLGQPAAPVQRRPPHPPASLHPGQLPRLMMYAAQPSSGCTM